MDPKIRERFQTFSIMILILVIWTLAMMTLEDRRRIGALERGRCWDRLTGQEAGVAPTRTSALTVAEREVS